MELLKAAGLVIGLMIVLIPTIIIYIAVALFIAFILNVFEEILGG